MYTCVCHRWGMQNQAATNHSPGHTLSDTPVCGRILIVEDEPSLAELFSYVLSLAGHQILLARDGSEALAMALRESPDLIVTDLVMPGLDGRQLCREVRGADSGRLAGTPVILLTGHDVSCAGEEREGRCADLCLSKPCSMDELRGWISLLLRRRQG